MELNDAKSNINHANRQSKNLDDVQALLDIKVIKRYLTSR